MASTVVPARRVVVLASAAVAVCLSSVGAIVAAAPTSAGCAPVAGAPGGRWSAVGTPPGVSMTGIGQADTDPCNLIGVDANHLVWRSGDGGGTWRRDVGAPKLTRLVTERLGHAGSAAGNQLVLASGPVATTVTGDVDEVYASSDGGAHFAPATTGGGASLLGDVVAAAAGATNDSPVFAIVKVAPPTAASPVTSPSPAPTQRNVLFVSADGGRSFAAAPGAASLDPTAVAIDPSNGDVYVGDGSPQGGAWSSSDGGRTFGQVCCSTTTDVRDVTVIQDAGGTVAVLLATDRGVLRSTDRGENWRGISGQPAVGVRTPPDDAAHVVVATQSGVAILSSSGAVPMPGLPATCAPNALRSDAASTAVFLADCAGRAATYRWRWSAAASRAGAGIPVPATPSSLLGAGLPGALPLIPLRAPVPLPDADTGSAALAFDGTSLYYKTIDQGSVGRVNATTGVPAQELSLGQNVFGLTFDLRRNQLLFTTGMVANADELVAYDVARQSIRVLAPTPDKAPSYDAAIDGISYIPEGGQELYRDTRTGGADGAHLTCTVRQQMLTSSYVAAGDGGGYVEAEDDSTIFRVGPPPACAVLGVYAHRTYSESLEENDSLPCDAQTFFPRVAIWIEDSATGSATPYAVPSGYCPMPSRLVVHAPATIRVGATATVCAQLTNATTHHPVAGRVVSVFAAGALLARGSSDRDGNVCSALPTGVLGTAPLSAAFAGDASLLPSRASGAMTVLGVVTRAAPRRAVVAVPPPPPPPIPAAPPAGAPDAPAGGASAVSPLQAAQGQAQSQAQSMAHPAVAAQRQTQPQLSLALAQQQLNTAEQTHAMVAPRRRDVANELPLAAGVVTALALASCCGFALSTARAHRRRGVTRR